MNKYIILFLFVTKIFSTNAQTVSTHAGTGIKGSADGSTSTATLDSPKGIAIDASGNIYFSDMLTNKIRKITPSGIVSTLAGSGAQGNTDGPGASASFRLPTGLAVDASGNVYVNHNGPFGSKIRKITPSGVVSSFAGTGEWDDYFATGKDGPGNVATFSGLKDMTIDAAGNLYVVDAGHRKIRKITPSGYVSTLAGSGAIALTDGTGSAAAFYSPEGITIDASGNLYVTETDHNKIRKITPSGVVTTFAGSGAKGNADGSKLNASFSYPSDIVADADGNFYVTDQSNYTIRKISANGTVSTFAGNGTVGNIDGKASSAKFYTPGFLALDASGNIYVTDLGNYKIRKISLTTNQSISGLSDMNKVTTDAPFILSATASSSLPITYSSSNTSVATISGNTVTITGAGTAIITASHAGNTTYSPESHSVTLTVIKAGQSISGFFNIYKNSVDVPFNLSAIASSGLGVSYYSSNLAVADIVGNTVTIKGVGTTTITASQAGNGKYDAATPISITLTVTQAIATIPGFSDMFKTIGDPDFTLPATSSTGQKIYYSTSNYSVASVFDNSVRVSAGGTATITASIGEVNPQIITATITVNKKNQSVSGLTNMTKVATDPSFTINAVSSLGRDISYTSSNPLVATVIYPNIIRPIGAGTTTITASNAGYWAEEAASQSVTLTVVKANQKIIGLADANLLTTSSTHNLYPYTTSGLPLTYSSSNPAVATVSGKIVTIIAAGTTTITATQAGDEKYAATSATAIFTVNKVGNYIYPILNMNKLITDASFDLGQVTSAGPISYTSSDPSVATVSGYRVTIVGLGTTTITASQAGNDKYEAASPVSATLTVSKASQTITGLADMTATVNTGIVFLNAGTSSGLTVSYTSSNPAVATVSGSTVTIVGAGTTTITASQAGNENYVAATPVTATLTVSKGNQTISAISAITKVGSDAPFTLPAKSNSGLTITYSSSNPLVATVSGNTVTIIGSGTTTITATQAGNSNYNAATPVSVTLTVSKANQTINNLYDMETAFKNGSLTLSATASSGLAVSYTSSNPAVATIAGNTVTIVGAGTTTITATQAGNAKFNAATAVTVVLTVSKVAQTISGLSNITKLVTDVSFNLNAAASSGLPLTYTSSNPLIATISGNKVTIVGAGTTNIIASQTGNTTYMPATAVTVTLTVNKLTQTISGLSNMSKQPSDVPFNLSAAASSGLTVTYISSNPLVATISGNKVTIVGAGTTTITASQVGNKTYNAAPVVTATLTVSTATQTISGLSNMSKLTTDIPFNLNATVSSGLPLTYTSSNPEVATVSGNKVTIVSAGTTTITASQVGNSNYNAATAVTAILIVSKATQTLSGLSDINKLVTDIPFNLNATVNSGLTLTYHSSNTAVATISGNKVTIVGKGTTIITASQAGNQTYKAISEFATLTVGGQTISGLSDITKNPGDGSFILDATSSSGLPIMYSSSDPSVATVSGNTITIVGLGTTVITASQQGDDNYIPAENVSVTLTVQLTTNIETSTISNAYKAYDGGDFTIIIEGDADVINVINLAGQSIYIGNSKQIRVESTGLFVVRIQHNNQVFVKKVVVR